MIFRKHLFLNIEKIVASAVIQYLETFRKYK
jgi:hypothetical protein